MDNVFNDPKMTRLPRIAIGYEPNIGTEPNEVRRINRDRLNTRCTIKRHVIIYWSTCNS